MSDLQSGSKNSEVMSVDQIEFFRRESEEWWIGQTNLALMVCLSHERLRAERDELLRQRCDDAEIIGNLRGVLSGVCLWDVPDELKRKIVEAIQQSEAK